ncbi:hypothetical protein L596_012634 [Steinernema carpocapsae]|uniref:Uncharacterized protein n=1 Tax=Steinernema carpocapsae TaxID=34508 RepID=A0A4U5NXP0_STECR|nr:hypothetical protein L596_012634 [Steinernema carpocapsae]
MRSNDPPVEVAPGLRISFLLSQNKSRFAPLLGGFATSLLPQSFTLLCTATIGGSAASSHLRRLRRFAASQLRKRGSPSGPLDLVPTITKQKSLCAPRWLRHLTLASKLYVASHSYDRRLRRLFPPSAASPLRSSAREARPSGPSDLVPTITKQKSLLRPSSVASPPRFCQHLTALRCFAQLRSAAPPPLPTFGGFAASPLRSSAREARPSGPSDLLSQSKSRFAPLGGFATSLCLKALRCFAQLRSAAPPPLPTFGGFAALQLRKRDSALRAFGSRSYYHKTKVALRPSVASPPHSCLKALRCFAQLRSAAPPPLPTFGGFAALQLRKRDSALRAFGSRSYYHKTKVALRPSSVASPTRVNAGGNDDSWSSWVSDVSLG